ncbi:DNA-binding transcriptional LysR family regulator [Neobacillus ginsengisoli]|uniref:DNA-binding transcriptional LysR family regulator n=2 Tax=Neobacillus ginsengisoli TaxID=904295 RepID=A0ABT9XWH6_9BACI|nr:DNA-binding transcriptional LysR family regulator [Neobacillus ginsengisoli]
MENIKLEDITKEKFIHFNADTELRNLIDSLFLKNNIHINVAYDGLEINSIIGLVTANMGIALVPESIIQNINLDFVYLVLQKS